MGEAIIPPWIRPESPETLRWIDDATIAFPPAFGRGTTQRGIWADPRWGLRRRYRGLRSDEKATILNALNETRGQFNVLRVVPHTPLRGTFPTTELLLNNTFQNGTTSWTASSGITASASDRAYMATRSANTGIGLGMAYQTVSVTQYFPYVFRVFTRQGKGQPQIYLDNVGTGALDATSQVYGMRTVAVVPTGSSFTPGLTVAPGDTGSAGDYLLLNYATFARCGLVDNGANLLARSDEFDNVTFWAKTRSSVTANAATAPDGTSTGDSLIEDTTASNSHLMFQTHTVSSAAADYSFSVALAPGARTFAALTIREAAGGHEAAAWFNLSTGAVGTTSTSGANMANVRAHISPLGGTWFKCTVTARKTNSATAIDGRIYLANADNSVSYTGNGASNIYCWRATLAQSSVPTRLVQSVAAEVSASAQSGSSLYVKGLYPISTNGLLLAGDLIEINGELKQLTAPVNTDGAGLAFLQFRPGLAGGPADNDPVIIHEPFGRFIYPPGTRELENLFGIYGDCEMNLEEVYV